MLGFLKQLFKSRKPNSVRLNSGTLTIRYSDLEKTVRVENISEIYAFARDDVVVDTLGIALHTRDDEYPFTEDFVGFPDAIIRLGEALGFDGDKLLLDMAGWQNRNAFTQWNECVWTSQSDVPKSE